jgi:hypothetical protein
LERFNSAGGFFVSIINPTHRKVIESIRYFIRKHGEAFPAYGTLASMVGCSTRHVVNLVKDLVEIGMLRKVARWSEENGQRRQLSNGYEIIEPVQPDPLHEEPAKPASSPYKSFYKSSKKSFKSFKKEEEEYKSNTREFLFVDAAIKQGIPKPLASRLCDAAKDMIQVPGWSWAALGQALAALQEHARRVGCVPAWFRATLRSELDKESMTIAGLKPTSRTSRTNPYISG